MAKADVKQYDYFIVDILLFKHLFSIINAVAIKCEQFVSCYKKLPQYVVHEKNF